MYDVCMPVVASSPCIQSTAHTHEVMDYSDTGGPGELDCIQKEHPDTDFCCFIYVTYYV